MASVNKVMLIGCLGRNLVARTRHDGQQIATGSLATNGGRGESAHTDWHNIEFPPHLCDHALASFGKGDQLYIEGSMTTHKHTSKRTKTDVYTLWIIVSACFISKEKINQ